MFPELHLFGQTIATFLIIMLAGIVVGNWGFARLVRRELKTSELQLIAIQVMLVLLFLGGGALGNSLLYNTPWDQLGNYTIMGSVILIAVGTPLVARLVRLEGEGRRLTDFVAVSFIPTQIFGKLGCFFAGCCYGTPWDSPLAVIYPEGSPAPAGIHLHAVQLYEGAALLLLWFLCWKMLQKKYAAGLVTGIFLIGKGSERFLAELLRGDVVKTGIGISTAQWAALICIAVGLLYILLRKPVAARGYTPVELQPSVAPEQAGMMRRMRRN